MTERFYDADPKLHAQAEELRARAAAEEGEKRRLEIADARPPEYSDESLALRFSEKHADAARHVAGWGKWLLWTGTHWQLDNTLRAFDMARIVCRIASAEITDNKKLAAAVASAKTVAATVSLARADCRHAVTVEIWNAAPLTFTTKDSLK